MLLIYLNYYCYILFFPILIISSMLIFLSNSWFSMWMIMEINLISFISMLIFDKKSMYSVAMSYFLIQSLNSYIYLMMSMFLNMSNFSILQMVTISMNMAILSKLSFFPMHLWYINIIDKMNWMNILILSTIQKIIPIYILSQIYKENNFLFSFNLLIMLMSSFLCSIIAMNHTSLKTLMGYSSMIQMSWVIFLMMINEEMMFNYFLIYFTISTSMFMIFYNFNFNKINNLFLMKFMNMKFYMLIMFMMFSLASIPPFFGFLMKWISIQTLFNMKFFCLIIFILNSLISMFFYLRVMTISTMKFNYSMKMNFKNINMMNNPNLKILKMNWMMIILLFIYEIF